MSMLRPLPIEDMTPLALKLLERAEELYGERDTAFDFLGVNVDPDGPQISFIMQITGTWIGIDPTCLRLPDKARYQIAHEVVHLLAPNRHPPTIMLEEGLAVHFSIFEPDFERAD